MLIKMYIWQILCWSKCTFGRSYADQNVHLADLMLIKMYIWQIICWSKCTFGSAVIIRRGFPAWSLYVCIAKLVFLVHRTLLRPTPSLPLQSAQWLVSSELPLPEAPHSSGAVWESRWPSWAVRPNEPFGFLGRKAILNHASALVTACP